MLPRTRPSRPRRGTVPRRGPRRHALWPAGTGLLSRLCANRFAGGEFGAPGASVAGDGPIAALDPPGRDLPRDHTRSRQVRDLRRPGRPPLLPLPVLEGAQGIRLEGARRLSDDEPLPRRRRVHPGPAFRRDALSERTLRPILQRQVRPHRPPVRRPLHLQAGRRRGVPRCRLHVRLLQPGRRRSLRLPRAMVLDWKPVRAPLSAQAGTASASTRSTALRSHEPCAVRGSSVVTNHAAFESAGSPSTSTR
jgi:hypothetical protein